MALTGNVCIVISETTTTQECHQNSDPNSGLPSSAEDFADAYQKSLNSSTSNTQACIEVDGSLYVNPQLWKFRVDGDDDSRHDDSNYHSLATTTP